MSPAPIRRCLAGALLAVLALTGVAACGGDPAPAPPRSGPVPASQAVPTPNSITLDRLGISSTLRPTGVDANGGFVIPDRAEQASWFSPGPEPGQNGRAMILGHVNLDGAPGVFARLHEAREGDEILIGQDDAAPTRWRVTRAPVVQDKAGWTQADMYRPLDHPEVALITCGGDLTRDAAGRGNYESNVIVYAEPVR